MNIKAKESKNGGVILTIAEDGNEKEYTNIILTMKEANDLLDSLVKVITKSENYNAIMPKDDIYYLDRSDGTIEKGIVFGVERDEDTGKKIVSVSVDFGYDFDEFNGNALGECLFISKEAAHAALMKTGKK